MSRSISNPFKNASAAGFKICSFLASYSSCVISARRLWIIPHVKVGHAQIVIGKRQAVAIEIRKGLLEKLYGLVVSAGFQVEVGQGVREIRNLIGHSVTCLLQDIDGMFIVAALVVSKRQ